MRRPGSLGADWIMMLLVNAELVELEIRPTHRLLLGVDTDPLRELVAGEDPLWQAIPIAPAQLARSSRSAPATRSRPSASSCPTTTGYLLVGDPDGLDDRLRRERMGRAVRAPRPLRAPRGGPG